MFVRETYRSDDWYHDINVCDSTGRLRTGQEATYHIAGPLCFSGDYIRRNVKLPADVCEGDYVLIHDTGAYTFSMWSLYNSRQFPVILGYEEAGKAFHRLRHRQSEDDIAKFWSGDDVV